MDVVISAECAAIVTGSARVSKHDTRIQARMHTLRRGAILVLSRHTSRIVSKTRQQRNAGRLRRLPGRHLLLLLRRLEQRADHHRPRFLHALAAHAIQRSRHRARQNQVASERPLRAASLRACLNPKIALKQQILGFKQIQVICFFIFLEFGVTPMDCGILQYPQNKK